MTDAVVTLEQMRPLGHINLRGAIDDPPWINSVERAVGQSLPVTANTLTEAKYRVYWLGPDELQIVCDLDVVDALCAKLRSALGGFIASVNDVSGGQVVWRARGFAVPELLAKGCTLDLHPGVFTAGCAAQSALGKTNILIGRLNDADCFELVVRRSFSHYFALWLKHATRDMDAAFI